MNNVYENLGRIQHDCMVLRAEYARLLAIAQQMADGTLDPRRFSADPATQTWKVELNMPIGPKPETTARPEPDPVQGT
jgi:hypothetical protein